MRVLAMLLLVLGALPAPAAAQTSEACTNAVGISWDVDHDDATVTAAFVRAPGCQDGERIGLQLVTEEGRLPASPLMSDVIDERASFDLEALNVEMRPVVGVRVLLYGEAVVEVVEIVVEQRFFSSTGNEQRGLLRTTTLEVPLGGQYEVPGAPTRYAVATCSDMRWTAPEDLADQGAGTFIAGVGGTHVVCYQQQPRTPGGTPDVDDPVVVDETAVLGGQVTRPGPVAPGSGDSDGFLASTGANLLALGLAGMFLLLVGRRVVRLRRD